MSKEVDDRVVSMEFDNSDFEKNVNTSMGTISHLKNALNFKGASDGLDTISKAAKNVNVNPIADGVQKVQASFSALEVIGVTALSELTTRAMHAGEQIASSLTIDPVKSGFAEYNTQMGAIQTILANTSNKGTTLDQVNSALDTLNHYADKTIYNFTQMTKNIGTFTAAGLDLQTSVDSIQGIANLAAVSGSTSEQASTAMYQLSQALSTGTVRLMDWNSVVNAGMGGQVFQNALIQTAENLGIDAKAAIDAEGSFRESLKTGWLTTQVLSETLSHFSMAVDTQEEYTAAVQKLVSEGYTEEAATQIADMAKTAADAATKVKTLPQLIDTLKEALGSGWTKTWQLIIGDFEQARTLWTEVSDVLSNAINASSDARNAFIGDVMGSSWEQLSEEITSIGIPLDDFKTALIDVARTHGIAIDDMITEQGSFEATLQNGWLTSDIFQEAAQNMVDGNATMAQSTEDLQAKLEYFQNVVDEVWYGTWDNGAERIEKLTEAGYDYQEVQDLVNATVDGHRLSLDELSDSQLEAIGYTEEQIDSLNKLKEAAADSNSNISQLFQTMDKEAGRTMIIDSIKNIVSAIQAPLDRIKDTFIGVFQPLQASSVKQMISNFKDWTVSIQWSDENLGKLHRTFEGFFKIIKLVGNFIGGVFTRSWNLLADLFGWVHIDILDITAGAGDAMSAFADWVEQTGILDSTLDNFFEFAKNGITTVVEFIKDAVDWIQNNEFLQGIWDTIEELFTNITEGVGKFIDAVKNSDNPMQTIIDAFASGFGTLTQLAADGAGTVSLAMQNSFEGIGPDLAQGFLNGLGDSFGGVIELLIQLGQQMIDGIKGVLGIHSPSTVFYDIGVNIVQGLINGIKSLFGSVTGLVSDLANSLTDAGGNVDWGSILTGVAAGGFLYGFIKIGQTLGQIVETFTGPVNAVTNVINGVAGFVNKMREVGDVAKTYIRVESFKTIAIAIGILVASVVALTLVDQSKLATAIGIVTYMAVLVGAITALVGKVGPNINFSNMAGLSAFFLAFGAAMILLGVALNIIGGIPEDGLTRAAWVMAGFAILIGALIAVVSLLPNVSPVAIASIGLFAESLGRACLILSAAMYIVGQLSPEQFQQGALIFAGLGIFILALVAVSGLVGFSGIAIVGLAGALIGITIAIGIMAIVAGLLSMIDPNAFMRGVAIVGVFGIFIAGFIAVLSGLAGAALPSVSGSLLAIAAAIGILAIVAYALSKVDPEEFNRGVLIMANLAALVLGMVYALKLIGGGEAMKLGLSLLQMAFAVGILAAIAVLLGYVEPDKMWRGVAAVSILGLVVAAMAKAAAGVERAKAGLIGLAIVVGVLGAVVFVLAQLEPDQLAAPTACMTILIAMMTMFAESAGKTSGAAVSIAMMAIVIAALGVVLYALASLPVENVIGSALGLSILMGTLAGVFAVIGSIGSVSAGALGGLFAVVGALALVAVIVGLLVAMDVAPSLETCVGLSVLLLALSAVTAILSAIGPTAAMAIQGAIALDAVIAIIGGLIVAIGGVFTLLPGLQGVVETGINILVEIFTGIGQMVGGLIDGFLTQATSSFDEIGPRLVRFAASAVLFATTLNAIPSGVAGKAAELATAIAAISTGGFIDSVMDFLTIGEDPIDRFCDSLVTLAGGMKSFSEGLGDGFNTAGVTSAANGIKVLTEAMNLIPPANDSSHMSMDDFSTQITAFGGAIKAFQDAVNQTEGRQISQAAIDAAIATGKGIAELANALPASGGLKQSIFGTNLDLTTFSTQIKAYGGAIKEFQDAVNQTEGRQISQEAVDSAIAAGKGIAELANALPASGGLAQSIFGTNLDLSTFSTQIKAFGGAIKEFQDAVNQTEGREISQAAVDAAIATGKGIAELADALPASGGLEQSIFGNKEGLDTFSTNIKAFGEALKDFAKNANILAAGNSLEHVQNMVGVGKGIAELAEKLPTNGPLASSIFGSSSNFDFASFGDKLSNFATAISSFGTTITAAFAGGGLDMGSIRNGVEAAKGITEIVTGMPTAEEFSGSIFADGTDLSNFGTQMANIGTAISSFSTSVAGIDLSGITNGVSAMQQIITLVDMINNSSLGSSNATGGATQGAVGGSLLGDLNNSLFSGIDISSLGTQLDQVAQALSDFSVKIPPEAIEQAKAAVTQLGTLRDDLNAFSGSSFEGLQTFIDSLNNIATLNIENIASALEAGNDRIVNAINGLVTSMGAAFDAGVANMQTIASDSGSAIAAALGDGIVSGAQSASDRLTFALVTMATTMSNNSDVFRGVGNELGVAAVAGISEGMASASNAVSAALGKAASSAMSARSAFQSAGAFAASGFALGIRSKTAAAVAAAASMARSASLAASAAIKVSSPSKVFKKIGAYGGEGFVIGIRSWVGESGKAGTELANSASTGLTSAVYQISQALDSDMDFNPVIRPVVDMTNVKRSSREIGGALGLNPTINAAQRLNRAYGYNQNGTISDVVKAVKDLKNSINNLEGNTITIGGISYDDGSAVSTAINDLTRAVRIEGRA